MSGLDQLGEWKLMRRALLSSVAALALVGAAQAQTAPKVLMTLRRPGWVLPGASVDMNFTQGQYFGLSPSQLTVSRASTEAEICNGQLYNFVANTPAITPGCGLWVWEARTNSVPNNSMAGLSAPSTPPTGWSISSVSGVTITWNNVATVNGFIVAVANITGTPTTNGSLLFQYTNYNVFASYGQTWTHSIFVAMSNTTNLTNLYNAAYWTTSGVAYIAGNYASISPTPVLNRYASNDYIPQSTAAYITSIFQFDVTSGQAVNTTLTIAAPQLELNPNLPASVASATVAGGGSLYVGASGTMTYSGAGCTTNPVLNVTTSAGAINAVTSVATAGVCPAANGLPVAGSTAWTPGGGLSVGTGASFNLVPTDNSAQGFATGPILTSSGAVTRAATNATGPLPSCSNPSVYVAGTPAAPTTYPVAQFAALVDDGGTTNLIKLIRSSSTGQPVVGTKTQTVTVAGGPWTQSTAAKLTESIGGGNVNGRFNGGVASTAAATSPPALNRLQIGSQGGVNNFNGVITTLAVACNGPSLLNN